MPSPTTTLLDSAIHARSIALVGITINNPEHWTRAFFQALQVFEYDGHLYLVNPRGGEVEGYKVYQKFEDIPDSVDLVISTVPAKVAPELVQVCATKGVKIVHFCTSGFAESGEEEGTKLQAEVVNMAKKTGVRIIGPNCMGFYCPETRISFSRFFPRESGSIGFVSQSGGNATHIILGTMSRGVRFSKLVSYGNACDLNESDFLEYLAGDSKTKVIGLYLEGICGGERFRRALREATNIKPVVLLKGGMTEGGSRAAAGHTGALAGSAATWDALCKQFGVIQVSSIEEMQDVLVTLNYLPRLKGRRVAMISVGGGASVLVTDELERKGLRIPQLPQEIRNAIRSYSPVAGNILGNPLDYSQNVLEPDKVIKTVSLIAGWKEIDFVIGYLNMPQSVASSRNDFMHEAMEAIIDGGKASSKQLAMILEPGFTPQHFEVTTSLAARCGSLGIPVYYSFAKAASALNLVLRHNENHKQY